MPGYEIRPVTASIAKIGSMFPAIQFQEIAPPLSSVPETCIVVYYADTPRSPAASMIAQSIKACIDAGARLVIPVTVTLAYESTWETMYTTGHARVLATQWRAEGLSLSDTQFVASSPNVMVGVLSSGVAVLAPQAVARLEELLGPRRTISVNATICNTCPDPATVRNARDQSLAFCKPCFAAYKTQ
jgi:hypothetical protein